MLELVGIARGGALVGEGTKVRKKKTVQLVITRRNDNMEDKRLLELTKAPVVYRLSSGARCHCPSSNRVKL